MRSLEDIMAPTFARLGVAPGLSSTDAAKHPFLSDAAIGEILRNAYVDLTDEEAVIGALVAAGIRPSQVSDLTVAIRCAAQAPEHDTAF